MGLFKNLNEVRMARARIAVARQHCIDSSIQLRHQLYIHPLTWPIVAGGVGFAAGFATINVQKSIIKIWRSPLSRGLLQFFVQQLNEENRRIVARRD
ncbi:hypothetical protein [Nitrosomonas sp.]|uniref:hypothetical protein n=1 Tax=Nitrosomonas sp. TaxID=42353 RepID=UPI0037CAAF54